MSPFIPLASATIAALLAYGRTRRLAGRPPLPRTADPRPRALAEAAAGALTVLVVGWILAASLSPVPRYVQPAFAIVAIGICLTQYRNTIRAHRSIERD